VSATRNAVVGRLEFARLLAANPSANLPRSRPSALAPLGPLPYRPSRNNAWACGTARSSGASRTKAGSLQNRIAYLLKRPVGRPANEVRRYYANFTYQAGSWTKPRRVVAKVEWHPGELIPRVGFIVTNMSRPAERIVAFYNKRGTCEQWIKEGKGAINWTRLSCRTFAANAAWLQLHALAYNLGNFLRTLATPEPIKEWSLTSLKEKLIKIGAKVVSHGRYVAFQMAEVAIPGQMFQEILRLIAELRPQPPPAPARGVRWSCVQEQLTGEVRPDVSKNGQISPFGRRAECQDCGQSSAPLGLARTRKKAQKFMPVRDSSGESRLKGRTK
jgi:hypothetical protein